MLITIGLRATFGREVLTIKNTNSNSALKESDRIALLAAEAKMEVLAI